MRKSKQSIRRNAFFNICFPYSFCTDILRTFRKFSAYKIKVPFLVCGHNLNLESDFERKNCFVIVGRKFCGEMIVLQSSRN